MQKSGVLTVLILQTIDIKLKIRQISLDYFAKM